MVAMSNVKIRPLAPWASDRSTFRLSRHRSGLLVRHAPSDWATLLVSTYAISALRFYDALRLEIHPTQRLSDAEPVLRNFNKEGIAK